MDVILPLNNNLAKTSLGNGYEAELCVIGVLKYFKGADRVFISSKVRIRIPDEYKDRVFFVDCDDPYPAKDANIINKIKTVLDAYPDISDEFLFISDDQIFIRETAPSEILPILKTTVSGTGLYQSRVYNTLNRFKNSVIINPHQPVIFNKKLFIDMCEYSNYDVEFTSVVIYILYYNYILSRGIHVEFTNNLSIYRHYHSVIEPYKGDDFPEGSKIIAFSTMTFCNQNFRETLEKYLL